MSAPEVGTTAPPLTGTTATGAAFDVSAPRARSLLIEFHRGTW